MSDDKYCRKCGTKKAKVPNGKFNTKTGKPEMKRICGSKDPCACGDHILDSVYGWRSWYRGEYRCRKCSQYFSFLYR